MRTKPIVGIDYSKTYIAFSTCWIPLVDVIEDTSEAREERQCGQGSQGYGSAMNASQAPTLLTPRIWLR